ncbi:MAG: ABC transporter substrate-binding protein [Actinomycetota bacterium]|nr:ABC transporter substrate-binding protein [Actinomycetota bacterium]
MALVAAVAGVAGLTGCGLVGASESQLDSVVVGSANFTESALLGEIYAQALEAEGVEVERQFNIGAREAYMKSIEGDNPSINVLPEYLGYLLEYYGGPATGAGVDAVRQKLVQTLPPELKLLQVSPATDEDAFVVTQETAQKYDLQSIGDLAPVADQLVVGGGPEFKTRHSGVAGMEEEYGVHFKSFKTLDPGGPLSEKALLSGDIQVSNFFTTQSVIEEEDLVVLEDPKNIIPPGNIVPVVRDDIPDGEQVARTLNSVQERLTTEGLTQMVKRVDVDKEPIEAVAEQFLTQEGLA